MERRKGQSPDTLLLWHGTSKTSPKVICESQEGFDLRLGDEGCMWGRAIYFADKVLYSLNRYAFVKASGRKCLLLAEVLVGDYVDQP